MNAIPKIQMSREEHAAHFGPAPREMPANIDAEQALLGALIMRNDAISAIPEAFRVDHFFEGVHEAIFTEIKRLHDAGRKADPITIKAGLAGWDKVGDLTIAQYLARLASSAVDVYNLPGYAAAITFDAMRRAFISIGSQAESLGYGCGDELTFLDEADALKNRLQQAIMGLDEAEDETLADAARSALDATSEAYRGKGIIGVDYGFAPLMSMIGPAMPGQLIVVGGGTKQGKSSLIEQVIMGAAVNAHPVWVYSGEMQKEEIAQRALSRITDIQAWRQIMGKVSEAEYERLEQARRNAETWQERVIIRDKPMTMTQIERSVENFSRRHEGGMAVIDHIGLVERDKATMRMTEQEFGPVVTRACKMLANKGQLPIFAAAQLKKNTFVSNDFKVTESTLRGVLTRRPKYTDLIGACEKDANHVVMPFRPEPILEELEPGEGELHDKWESLMESIRGKAEIRLSLSRHKQYPQYRKVGWNGARTMFEDLTAGDQGRMF